MIARLVTLFPDPDSPTTPSVSPRRSVNERLETAWTIPSRVLNRTERSRTSSRVEPADVPIGLGEAYARIEEGEDGDDRRQAGAQTVLEDHPALGQPLRTGGADVVLAERLEQVVAREAGVDR